MDVDAMLDLRAQQRPAVKPVVAQARVLLAKEADIDRQQYQAGRNAELKADVRARTAQDIAAALRQMLADDASETERTLAAHDQAAHERAVNANGHTVDTARISAETTPAGLLVLWREARAASADDARRARAFIEPRLHTMAQREAREHRQPGATSAFNALCMLQTEAQALATRSPGRGDLADAARSRQRDLRAAVLDIADLVSLRRAVEQAMTQKAVPASPEGKLVVGGWFDRFGGR